MKYRYRFVFAVLLVGLLIGCGGHRSGNIDPEVQPKPTPGQFGLPAPEAALLLVPKGTSSTQPLERYGVEYVPGLAQLVTDEAPSARFNSEWIDGSSGFDSLAYAVYSFDVQTYYGQEIVTFEWSELPLDITNLWIGFSNWNSNNWDWYNGSSDGILDLQDVGYGDYTKAGTGEMLIAVVILNTDPAQLFSLSVGDSPPTQQGDWWMFGHDPQHTRRSPYVGALNNNVKWFYETGEAVFSSPTIADDGTVYVGSYDNKVYALNRNGAPKGGSWPFETGGQVWSSPAIGYDGTVYVGSNDSKLYAINPDGTEKWFYETTDMVETSPVIGVDRTVYIGNWDYEVIAINPDGTEKWSTYLGDIIVSSPAIAPDGTIYIGCMNGNLYALNQDGTEKWFFETGSFVNSSPAIGADGTVYAGSWDDKLYAINPDGTEKWSFLTGGHVDSSPAIGSDGTIYVGSWDNSLYAINPDGTDKWSFDTAGEIKSSPAIDADGTVFVGSGDQKFYAINSDGTEKWSYTAEGAVDSSPAIAEDGTVYVGSHDGKLYAFGGDPTWQTTVVVENDCEFTALIVAVGKPAICYYDTTNQDLMFVRAMDTDGNYWGTPKSIDAAGGVGTHLSLAIVDGNPAISYYDETNGHLKYVRATDPRGVGWYAPPIAIDTTGSAGFFTSLVVVEGNPAIGYVDNANGNLKYIRATNATGSNWGNALIVSYGGEHDWVEFPSIAIVDGNPAIGYMGSAADLMYVRANDTTGGSWGTPVAVEIAQGVGWYASLVVVNGNPAIGYQDNGSRNVKYVRATDATGSAWGTPIALTTGGFQGMYLSMAVVYGKPAVSYGRANQFLEFTQALDANGTTWSTPILPDPPYGLGWHTSLAVVNGSPAISYVGAFDSIMVLSYARQN